MALDNPLKKKLAAGNTVLGVWAIIPSPMVAEVLAEGGFDFIIIDMEHGAYDLSAMDASVRACEAAGASPIVRLPGLNFSAAQWALDAGAHGIVVPQISGVDEAREAVALAKLPPQGKRGYNPFTRAAVYSGNKNHKAGKLDNDFPLTSVIVENKQSIDELDKICAIRDLDMIYIGVYDLSFALGCNGDTSHPKIQKCVSDAVAKIRKSGKAAGLMVKNQADMDAMVALGANVILCAVDTALLLDAAQRAVTMLSNVKRRKRA